MGQGHQQDPTMTDQDREATNILLVDAMFANTGELAEVDDRRIPTKDKMRGNADGVLATKPLRSMKAIQSMKDFAE
jgi:Ni,Fe-hydrogenase maturation factor